MNKLDKQYTDLLQDILDNGVQKKDRTGTGTISVFGRQIRHNMKDGFPLLTTKKMPFKTIVTELLWFLQGNTNIKFLVNNGCNIWNGDAFKNYYDRSHEFKGDWPDTQEDFIDKIKTDDKFAEKWGDLGPIYGKQWRSWRNPSFPKISKEFSDICDGRTHIEVDCPIDQIQNLINDLKTNPDSRRLMVSAWNVGELDQMVLPPCHYGFQVYTRELSGKERWNLLENRVGKELFESWVSEIVPFGGGLSEYLQSYNIPKRSITLMWNQRSVDTFLGLPFNIASYGVLLELIAREVNMVPEELIGNLGDVHLYSNHIEQAKEQIGRHYTFEERVALIPESVLSPESVEYFNLNKKTNSEINVALAKYNISPGLHTRRPFPLPKINFNSEWWDKSFFELVMNDNFCKCLLEEDIQLYDYQSHPTIKAPLSN